MTDEAPSSVQSHPDSMPDVLRFLHRLARLRRLDRLARLRRNDRLARLRRNDRLRRLRRLARLGRIARGGRRGRAGRCRRHRRGGRGHARKSSRGEQADCHQKRQYDCQDFFLGHAFFLRLKIIANSCHWMLEFHASRRVRIQHCHRITRSSIFQAHFGQNIRFL